MEKHTPESNEIHFRRDRSQNTPISSEHDPTYDVITSWPDISRGQQFKDMYKLTNKRILKVSSRSDTIYGSNSRKSMRGRSDPPPPQQMWGLNWSVWEDHCFTRQTNYCYTHPRLHVGVCWRQFRHCFLGRWSLGNIVSGARTGKTRDLFNKK